jgi:hypothetical protein
MDDNTLIVESQKHERHQREHRTIRFSVAMGALLLLGMTAMGVQCECQDNQALKSRIHECQDDLAEHHHLDVP